MPDIIDIQRKFADDSQKELLIFNPLREDITCQYDGQPYSIPSKENKSFKTHIAKHVGEYIVDLYIATKDKNYSRDRARKLVFSD